MAILDPEDFKKYGVLPKIPPDGTRCNARLKQTRGYCKNRPAPNGSGRCRFHCGPRVRSLGYQLTMSSRSNYLPPELKARFEGLTGDAISNLEDTLRLQESFETQLLDQLSTGESHQAWKLLNELIVEHEHGDDKTRPQTFNRIKQVAQGGLKAYGVKKEILDLHERQRKQAQTLVQARKEVSETWTTEQDRERMSILLRILKLHCDGQTLRAIAQDFEREKLASSASIGPTVEVKVLEADNGMAKGVVEG